jgi:hypothetical protein
METSSRKLKKKYLISWAIMGSVIGLVISLAVLFQKSGADLGTVVIATLIGGPCAMLILAGMGLLTEGFTKYNWRFGEIEHQPWIWHIYPIVGSFHFCIALPVIAISIITMSKFDR